MAKEEKTMFFNKETWHADYRADMIHAVHEFAKHHRIIQDEHSCFVTVIADGQDFGMGSHFEKKKFWEYLEKWLKNNKLKTFKSEDLQTFLDVLASLYGEYDRKIVPTPKVSTAIAAAILNGLNDDYDISCSHNGRYATFRSRYNRMHSYDCGYGGAGLFWDVDGVVDKWLEDNCGLRFCDGEMAKKYHAFIARNLKLVANEVFNDEDLD